MKTTQTVAGVVVMFSSARRRKRDRGHASGTVWTGRLANETIVGRGESMEACVADAESTLSSDGGGTT